VWYATLRHINACKAVLRLSFQTLFPSLPIPIFSIIPTTPSVLIIDQLHRRARKEPWRALKRAKTPKRSPRYCKSIQSGTFGMLHRLLQSLTACSFQDALRAFFQPIKTDDPRLDFYTMYKREAAEYDAHYVKKYDEDLNTTLIFVSRSSFALLKYLTRSCRQACSLLSAQLSSSMSIRTFDPIRTSNL
jgi:hypothetical protein